MQQHVALKSDMIAIPEGKKPFTCVLCDKKFKGKHDLNNHITAIHEGKNPYSRYKNTLQKNLKVVNIRGID